MCFCVMLNKIVANTPYRIFDAELCTTNSLLSHTPTWVHVNRRLLEVLQFNVKVHLYHRDVHIKEISRNSDGIIHSFAGSIPNQERIVNHMDTYHIDETSTLAIVITAHLSRAYFIIDPCLQFPFVGFNNDLAFTSYINAPVFFTDPNDKDRAARYGDTNYVIKPESLSRDEYDRYCKEGPGIPLSHPQPIDPIVLWRSDQHEQEYNQAALQARIITHIEQQYPEFTFHSGSDYADIVAKMLESPPSAISQGPVFNSGPISSLYH